MSDLSVGSTFAGCRLESVAGRGGMGIVFRGTQLTLGRQVALKAMAPDLAKDDVYRERFQRESHIAASIDHPNVIPVYAAGELDGTLYLMMRWVDGTDLRSVLADGARLKPSRAIRLLRPVASALASAHRRGLVHRDIKPANVLIAQAEEAGEEHVYLTDFGIARRTGEASMTRTGLFVGTVDYSAPERLEGGHGDARADIYSFGCMLFETLTGHVPFARPTDVSKIFAHMNDPVPSARSEVADVPEPLDALIAKAMAKRPEDRFDSAAELATELGELLQQLDTRELELKREADRPTRVARPEPETVPVSRVEPETAGAAPAGTHTAVAPAPTLADGPRPERGGRNRSPARLAAPILAAVVIAAVLVVLLAGGGKRPAEVGSSPHSATPAAAILSLTGPMSSVRTIDLGGAPAAVTAGANGNVWASLPGKGTLVRVRGATGRTDRFTVGGHPSAIADGIGGLWVAGSGAGALARFSPATGTPVAAAHVSTEPVSIAVDPGDGSAWAADPSGAITHVSAAGAVLGAPVRLSAAVRQVAVGEGWLWAAGDWPVGLARIGLGGSAQATIFDTGSPASAVSFDQGVWVAHPDGRITRFDPRPGRLKVNAEVRAGSGMEAIAGIEGHRAVWAISGQDRSLYRISNESSPRMAGRVTFASPPVGLTLTGRNVWVATQDGRLVQLVA